MGFKELLKGKLTEDELKLVRRSFDVIGDIAIVEIPKELENKEKIIGEAILEHNKHIKVVAKKLGKTQGVERIRPVKIIAGENRTKTIHKENGCKFIVDIAKVFFTPRLSTERLRVIRQVKPGEEVLDMFAGVGPYAVPIGKKTHVHAVDINKYAYDLLKHNIAINKSNVTPYLMDVRKVDVKADRIIMNLPHESHLFLDVAKRVSKDAIVHFYIIGTQDELNKKKELIKRYGGSIINVVKCGEYAPRVSRWAIDFSF